MPPATSRAASTRPAPAPGRRSEADLGVVRRERTRPARSKRRLAPAVAACLVAGSLITVVVADGLVAQDQIRLTVVDQQLADASARQTSMQTAIAEQTAPPVVVHAATTRLGMVSAQQVTDLPGVSLETPLPPPDTGTTVPVSPKR